MSADEYRAARYAGETAGRNGLPAAGNPYAVEPTLRDVALGEVSAKQQTLAGLWRQGWRAGMRHTMNNTKGK